MINAVFIKIMENVRKHRDIKFVTANKKRNYLVLEPNSLQQSLFQKIY